MRAVTRLNFGQRTDPKKEMAAPVTPSVRKWELVWYNIAILTAWHVGAVYGLYELLHSSWAMLAMFISLWWFSGLGITAGAHRLWAHRSYKAASPLLFRNGSLGLRGRYVVDSGHRGGRG